MKLKKILFYIFVVLAVATDVLILVEAAIGGNKSAGQSLGVTQLVIDFVKIFDPNSPIVLNPDVTHAVVRKLVGHFGLFGASGLFSTIAMLLYKDVRFDKKMVVFAISEGSGLVLAFVSELIQLATPGRFFSIGDVFIDYSGYIIFSMVVFFSFFIVYKDKEND